jgi:hypothetical protein
MIRIDQNALYTRSDLAALLAGSGVDVDLFIGRIKARKVFKMLWLGEDILAALRAAPALSEREEARELPSAGNRGNRRGRGPADDRLEPLRKLMR